MVFDNSKMVVGECDNEIRAIQAEKERETPHSKPYLFSGNKSKVYGLNPNTQSFKLKT